MMLGQSVGPLSGPAFAYIFDKNLAAVRPLLGIAGSATIGPPIDLGFPITDSLSLPDQRILVVPVSGPYLLSVDLGITPPASRSITGALKSADITLSPGGKTAALVDKAGQLVEVITGLPDHPAVTLEISTAGVSAPLQRVVVNDAGNLLLMTFLENGHETIYRWNGTEGFRVLADTKGVGALSFVGNSDAVYADKGTNEVFLSHDVTKQSVTQFIAGPTDGVSGPIGLNASATGGFFLANSITMTVMTFDALGRIVQTQQCNCDLAGIYPLATGIFRLTDRLNRTLQLLDDGAIEKRLIFVPPLQ
jgi:hypothetical protein